MVEQVLNRMGLGKFYTGWGGVSFEQDGDAGVLNRMGDAGVLNAGVLNRIGDAGVLNAGVLNRMGLQEF